MEFVTISLEAVKEALKEAGLDLVAVSQMEAEEANAVINAFANEAVSAENTLQPEGPASGAGGGPEGGAAPGQRLFYQFRAAK